MKLLKLLKTNNYLRVPIIGTLFLFGCANYKKSALNINEFEARYFDISIPCGIKKIDKTSTGYNYYINNNIDITSYYKRNMEINGWRLLSIDKSLMVYEKPFKISIIKLNTQRKNILVEISIINKC